MSDMETRNEEDLKINQDEAADEEVRVGPFVYRFYSLAIDDGTRHRIAGMTESLKTEKI